MRNACKGTCPIMQEGKLQSRCNAVRHGLTAETVVGTLDDGEDHKAFEAAVINDYEQVWLPMKPAPAPY